LCGGFPDLSESYAEYFSQSTESSAFLLTIESASVTMSSMNMTFAVSVPNCLELLGNLSYSFFLIKHRDGSLCTETAIVFSFPGRAKALPGVVFTGKSVIVAGNQGKISASRANRGERPETGLSTQRAVPCVPSVVLNRPFCCVVIHPLASRQTSIPSRF